MHRFGQESGTCRGTENGQRGGKSAPGRGSRDLGSRQCGDGDGRDETGTADTYADEKDSRDLTAKVLELTSWKRLWLPRAVV